MTEKDTGKNSIFPQNLAKALDIKCSIRAKFAASQPRSLAASQPRSLAASSCPNNSRTHTNLLKAITRTRTGVPPLCVFYFLQKAGFFGLGLIQSKK